MQVDIATPFGPGLAAYRAESERLARRFEDAETAGHGLVRSQTRYLLLKFFLQQIDPDAGHDRDLPGERNAPGDLLNRVLERDFDGLAGLRKQWLQFASQNDTRWIIGGLSFATFRFHLFPARSDTADIPFCVSPILVSCVDPAIYEPGTSDLQAAHEANWSRISMRVIENRVACLQKPLALFEEAEDCQGDGCAAG